MCFKGTEQQSCQSHTSAGVAGAAKSREEAVSTCGQRMSRR